MRQDAEEYISTAEDAISNLGEIIRELEAEIERLKRALIERIPVE